MPDDPRVRGLDLRPLGESESPIAPDQRPTREPARRCRASPCWRGRARRYSRGRGAAIPTSGRRDRALAGAHNRARRASCRTCNQPCPIMSRDSATTAAPNPSEVEAHDRPEHGKYRGDINLTPLPSEPLWRRYSVGILPDGSVRSGRPARTCGKGRSGSRRQLEVPPRVEWLPDGHARNGAIHPDGRSCDEHG